MKNFIFNKKKISLIDRIRIPENRDLKKGLRLNRNERVDNFSKDIIKSIIKNINEYDLGKYPDQNKIYKVLANFIGENEKNILLTSGIDGGIKSILEIFTDTNESIGVLHPTYAMYEVYSRLFNLKYIKINYKNFKLDKKKLYKLINSKKIKILFIPNPNQPIEDNISYKEMKKICQLCKQNKILLVVDEAYYMFGAETCIKLTKKYKNILILRTFSKSFGLPSIRLGYIVGPEKIIKSLQSYRLSYESNFFTNIIAEYFINNFSKIKSYIDEVKKGRDFLKDEMKKLNFEVIGGKSNFLLINFKNKLLLNKILDKLKYEKIYVKSNFTGEISNCILVTCGRKKTMKKLSDAIKQETLKFVT